MTTAIARASNAHPVHTQSGRDDLRELEPHEIEALSGGVVGIAIGAGVGAVGGALVYSYGVAVNGQTFTWTGLAAETLQGGIIGALGGAGGFLFTVEGGVVAGVTAEGLATVIKVTDPAQSLSYN